MTNPDTTPQSTHTFTPEDIAEHLRGLASSADLIASLVAANDRSEEAMDTMDRNVRHIGIMCVMDHLKDQDLQPFQDAAAAGSAWMTNG